jgi:hypothetical protein
MWKTAKAIVFGIITLLGWLWFLLDLAGRGLTVLELNKIFPKLVGFLSSHQEIGYQIAPWVLMVGGIASMALLQWPWLLHLRRRSSVRVATPNLCNANTFVEAIPDWTIRELFFYLSPNVTDAKSKMWQKVGSEVRDKFSLGILQCWGREMGANRRRSPIKPIEKSYWHNAEFIYWFFDEKNRQSDHVRNERLGISYADLQVNKAEALAIKWPIGDFT